MTRPMLPIPIEAGKAIADRYGYDQVVIIARRVGDDPQPRGEHVTTYGRDPGHCKVAARMGDFIKHKVMQWPEGDPWTPATTVPAEADGEVFVRFTDGSIGTAWATYWHGASNGFAQWSFPDPDERRVVAAWMKAPAQQEGR